MENQTEQEIETHMEIRAKCRSIRALYSASKAQNLMIPAGQSHAFSTPDNLKASGARFSLGIRIQGLGFGV